ncbi:hypothetical protein Nepgr_016028 [Nepenthes gracilis]|uniref:Uncharacterized protein n=1 Tax=Nepenthes gracilis TaxID=150966 RepID=A0AAD3XQX4_NEPGR|nr:hypothetical protein Nepgr_016028 [Nepenthes gracilis]
MCFVLFLVLIGARSFNLHCVWSETQRACVVGFAVLGSNCYVFKGLLKDYAQKVGYQIPIDEITTEGPPH